MKKSILLAGLVTGVIATPTLMLTKGSKSSDKASATLVFPQAYAADTSKNPTDTCQTAFQAVIEAAPKANVYTNNLLQHIHEQLYRFNSIETADVEMIFCRMNQMGITASSVSSTAQSVTKTDPIGNTIVATIITPTESWATTLGYTAKLTVTSQSSTATSATQFLALWWKGTDTSTAGYVIQGANPQQNDGNTRLRYAQWDRTGTSQWLKFFGAQFGTAGYLQTAAAGTSSKSGGDHTTFARLTYNSTTAATTAQQIEIRQGNVGVDRKTDTTADTTSSFACVKTYMSGTIGGTITGFRPAKGKLLATTDTSKDGTGLDGDANVTDATTTADHSGSPTLGTDSTNGIASGTFDYSCNGVYTANASSGNVFYSSGGTTATVSFTMAPSSVFPN